MYLDVRIVLKQALGGGCMDVGVAWMFGCDVEDCVVPASDILSGHRRRLQLLLKSNQHAYSGDQNEGESGEHG